ncbi:hypothetical protein B0A55_06303, partial [Friedmanniomyces simplex]
MPFFHHDPTDSIAATVRSYVKVTLARLNARANRPRQDCMTATTPKADGSSPASSESGKQQSFIGGAKLRRQQEGASGVAGALDASPRDQIREAWHADQEVGTVASGQKEEVDGPVLGSFCSPLLSSSQPGKASDVADSVLEESPAAEHQELLRAWWGRPKSIQSDDGSVVSGEEFRGRRRQRLWEGMAEGAPRRHQKKRSQPRQASPARDYAASPSTSGSGPGREAWYTSSARLAAGQETVASTPATSSGTIAAIP